MRRTVMTHSRFPGALSFVAALLWTITACQTSAISSPATTANANASPPRTSAPPTPTSEPSAIPTANPVAIEGLYETSFSKEELAASPLLADAGEVNDGNWGEWTLTLAGGRVEYTQTNNVESSSSSGTFAVAGNAITLVFDEGATAGETFAYRWHAEADTLTFTRDDSLRLDAPTPFLLKTWTKVTEAAPLADGGTVFPGYYSTRFEPALTLTIGNVVNLDCFPGYRCRGDIDVNLPNWVGFEFGNEHGNEFNVIRIDQITDPDSPGTLVDPPVDLAGWISTLPGVDVLEPPKAVVVGGIASEQLDVMSDADTPFGPTGLTGPDDPQWFGLAANHRTRVILLRIDGHVVMITEQIGVENTVRDFEAAVDGLQPLVDSIVWSHP